jgi:hypothetical protein
MNSGVDKATGDRQGLVARWALTVLVAIAICACSFGLWAVPLGAFELKSDDFVYLARSRTAESLRTHWFAPHNGHVVPLFMLETHLLARLAGTLERVPGVLGGATFLTLVVCVLLTGHLVAWETGRTARGLAAMAAVGFTSVMGTSVLWYSAGQALGAGALILAMLVALRAWRARGAWIYLVFAGAAAVAAPLMWTAGYVAGAVGAAYLWADGRRACRFAAIIPIAASISAFIAARNVSPRFFAPPSSVAEKPNRVVFGLAPAVIHSTQAVCEALVFNNLGLDAPTTPAQAMIIGSVLAGAWLWTRRQTDPGGRRRLRPINPLEAAGATLVATGFGIVFIVRGTDTTYDGLRALGWYNAIPALGGVLFAAGWWSGEIASPPPTTIAPPDRLEFLVFALVAGVILVLQTPRVDRVIFVFDGLSAKFGPERSRRTATELNQMAQAQRQSLAALDQLEKDAREFRRGRAETRQLTERIIVPGMPTGFVGVGPAELVQIAGRTD